MTGLIVLAKPVVLFLGGIEYLEAIPTLRILSFALIFAIVGGFLSSCINIPTGKRENLIDWHNCCCCTEYSFKCLFNSIVEA